MYHSVRKTILGFQLLIVVLISFSSLSPMCVLFVFVWEMDFIFEEQAENNISCKIEKGGGEKLLNIG